MGGWKSGDPLWIYGGPSAREPWVGEWIVLRRKMEQRPWRDIAAELNCTVSTAQRIYKETLGPCTYTGPLPEWVEPDHLCEICRQPLIGEDTTSASTSTREDYPSGDT